MEEPDVPPEVRQRLRDVMDFTRDMARVRLEALTRPDARIEPFGAILTDEELRGVVLDDVAEHLTTPEGTSRVAASLVERFGARAFAVATAAWSSPDGSPEHPQRREVVRVVVGDESGLTGALFGEVQRRAEGPRLTGIWETGGEQ